MTHRAAKQPAKTPPRVELRVGTWKQYGRGIIEGVWRYAQKHGPWLIEVEPTEDDESTAIQAGMAVDGIIAVRSHARVCRQASGLRSAGCQRLGHSNWKG